MSSAFRGLVRLPWHECFKKQFPPPFYLELLSLCFEISICIIR